MGKNLEEQTKEEIIIDSQTKIPSGLKQIGESVYVNTRRPFHIVLRDIYMDYIKPIFES